MTDIQNFILWILQNVPSVLLQPPFSAFTGICLLSYTACLFKRIISM